MNQKVRKIRDLNNIRMLTVAALLLPLLYSCLSLYSALQHNPQGEYCEYGVSDNGIQITVNDTPCVLTAQFYALFGVVMMFIAVPAQLICLTLWGWFAFRNWRITKKNVEDSNNAIGGP